MTFTTAYVTRRELRALVRAWLEGAVVARGGGDAGSLALAAAMAGNGHRAAAKMARGILAKVATRGARAAGAADDEGA